jgi:hypothetical protein
MASEKFELSKSPSLISALDILALVKLQSLATVRSKSRKIIFAPIKVLFVILASLKLALFSIESLKLHCYRFA